MTDYTYPPDGPVNELLAAPYTRNPITPQRAYQLALERGDYLFATTMAKKHKLSDKEVFAAAEQCAIKYLCDSVMMPYSALLQTIVPGGGVTAQSTYDRAMLQQKFFLAAMIAKGFLLPMKLLTNAAEHACNAAVLDGSPAVLQACKVAYMEAHETADSAYVTAIESDAYLLAAHIASDAKLHKRLVNEAIIGFIDRIAFTDAANSAEIIGKLSQVFPQISVANLPAADVESD